MIRRIALWALALLSCPLAAVAQFQPGPNNSVGLIGVDSVTHLNCYVGASNPNCVVPTTPGGGTSAPVAPYVATPRGPVFTSVSGTAIGFTPPTGATYCYISVSVNAINYRTDGVAPTASVGGGVPLAVGTQLVLSIAQLSNFKAIAQTGTASEIADCYS